MLHRILPLDKGGQLSQFISFQAGHKAKAAAVDAQNRAEIPGGPLGGVHDGAVPSQGHHHVARGDDFVRLLTGELLRFGGKQHLGAQLFQSSADAAQRLTAAGGFKIGDNGHTHTCFPYLAAPASPGVSR